MSTRFDYQGFDVSAQWNGALTSASYASALDSIASVGSNSVSIMTKLFVASGTSGDFVTDPVQSTSDASLVAGIKAAEAKGLKVILEPHIAGLDGTNANALAPTDANAFLAAYKAQIVHLATVAQATGVDTLSLGNEMATLSGSQYRAQWLDVIASVRAVYSGKLTYEAATNEASAVSFWDKVDTIGVNAYLSLSASSNPTVAQLEAAWTTPPADTYWNAALNGLSMVDFMQSLATTYGKQVLVTEVGYRSIDGAATKPSDSNAIGTADNTDQTNAYQALFQVMQSRGGSWFAGLELFEYNIGLSNQATSYSPLGKPAMAIVQQYFSGTGSVTGLQLNGSAVNDLIDVGAGDDTIDAGLGNDIIKVGAGNDTINAGPDQITTLKTSTITITGYGANGQVQLLINGQKVGNAVTFTPATDTSGYQTYTFTFTNPDAIKSLDLSILNASGGGNAMIRAITINGAALSTSDVTNASSPGTFNLYAKSIHLDATKYQDWFYGTQSDDDVITVGTGNDTINGGAGLDTVVFKGKASDYTLSRVGDTLYVTDGVAGRNGTTTLTHVEYLQFADNAYAVATLLVPDQGSSTVSALMTPLMASAVLSAGTSSNGAKAPALAVSGASAGGATVSLMNGTSVLATTTADAATGAYAFSLANLAAGVYTLATSAALNGLSSSASDPVTVVVGTAANIVSLIQSTSTVPRAVYVTDASNPIVVSVDQLRAVSAALSHSVTANTLTVSDTAAQVVANIDLLGTQTTLGSIVLTDTNTFAVSGATMKAMLADDAAVLGKIQGGYFFAVTATSASGAVGTTTYDSTGTVTQTQTVSKLANGGTETYTVRAAGGVSDVFTDASGAKTSQSITDSTGKHVTTYGITGKSYTSSTSDYDTSGKLATLTQFYANGQVYQKQVTANGVTTTDQYDTAGTHVQEVVATSSSTDTITYTATGAKSTETLVDAAGKHVTTFGITGKSYVTATYDYNAAGAVTGLTQWFANGQVYQKQATANGVTTTDQYDTAGTHVQEVVATSSSTDTITYTATGAKSTETLVDGTGKHVTTFGITGKSYVTATTDYDAAGTMTGFTQWFSNGQVYLRQVVAANGVTTTDQYDTSGAHVQTVIVTPAATVAVKALMATIATVSTSGTASTQTITYNAAGAKATDTLVDGTGKHATTFGITGKSYVTATTDYNTAGAMTGLTQYFSNGQVYLRQVIANGVTTTDQYDTSGAHVQKVVATSSTTDTITYTATGAKGTEILADGTGKHVTTYGITGKSYTTATIDYSPAGVMTGQTQLYANGAVYLRQVIANGVTTTDQYDTAGVHVQQVVATATSTDTITYTAAGAKSTETLVNASGKHVTTYGITGKTYTVSTSDYDTAGKLTGLTQYDANGAVYLAQTVAANGTITTNQYDTTGARVSQTVATGTTTDTITYTAGAKSTETLVDAAGKHVTTFGITGKSYTASTADYSTAGVLQDIVQSNTDGSQNATFYAAGASLSFSNAKTAITSFGGDTMTFASTPFADTIKNFQGGAGSGHDTIVLSKSLATDFSHLAIATAGQTTTITLDSQHSLTFTGMAGSLTASNFRFV